MFAPHRAPGGGYPQLSANGAGEAGAPGEEPCEAQDMPGEADEKTGMQIARDRQPPGPFWLHSDLGQGARQLASETGTPQGAGLARNELIGGERDVLHQLPPVTRQIAKE